MKLATTRTAMNTPIAAPLFSTDLGQLYVGKCEEVLPALADLKGRVQLVLTSPPFPLKRKKRYGNLQGEEYLKWLRDLAPILSDLLSPTGSLVVEIGNAWEPARPVQSLLPMKALLALVEHPTAGLRLCQEFICYNPARLPSPAQWVTIDRIRVKDSFTRVWWMSRTDRPDADNRRVLKEYSKAMRELLERRGYNSGVRPSQHYISKTGFLKDHGGAIPSNFVDGERNDHLLFSDVIEVANTGSTDGYQQFCRDAGVKLHPARMPWRLAEFFIKFLTKQDDIVVDPFSGSNIVGAAAQALNRHWVSIEARRDYADASIARFRKISGTHTKRPEQSRAACSIAP